MMTKYDFVLGYTVFFLIFEFLLIGYAGSMSASFGIAPPTCTAGALFIDGLIECAWNYFVVLMTLMTISSSVAVVQGIFVTPFIVGMIILVADLVRGSG